MADLSKSTYKKLIVDKRLIVVDDKEILLKPKEIALRREPQDSQNGTDEMVVTMRKLCQQVFSFEVCRENNLIITVKMDIITVKMNLVVLDDDDHLLHNTNLTGGKLA